MKLTKLQRAWVGVINITLVGFGVLFAARS